MRKEKRGQAAMEFLMTYGWAILAAIIVIAVIAIYFRPSTLVSNSVMVNAPFYGVGTVLATTQIEVEVRNNGGEDLTNVLPALTFNQPALADCTAPANLATLGSGATTILTFTVCTGLNPGDTVSADISISYNRPGSTLDLTSTRSLSGKVPS